MSPYQVVGTKTPRKIEIERKKRLFAQQACEAKSNADDYNSKIIILTKQ